jgi:hypothetical protein
VNNSQNVVAATLTISPAIKFTWTTGAKPGLSAVSVSGLASSPLDANPACTTGTGTGTGAVASGGLVKTDEIAFGYESTSSTQTIGSCASGFTCTLTGASIGSGNSEIHWAYAPSTLSIGGITYTQNWTTSRPFGANVITFKSPTSSTRSNLLLLGVGQ